MFTRVPVRSFAFKEPHGPMGLSTSSKALGDPDHNGLGVWSRSHLEAKHWGRLGLPPSLQGLPGRIFILLRFVHWSDQHLLFSIIVRRLVNPKLTFTNHPSWLCFYPPSPGSRIWGPWSKLSPVGPAAATGFHKTTSSALQSMRSKPGFKEFKTGSKPWKHEFFLEITNSLASLRF